MQRVRVKLIGMAAGVPLGIAIGRGVWREVAGFIPLAYQPPATAWGLALVIPGTLLAANLLALWPGHQAARLRPAEILRAE